MTEETEIILIKKLEYKRTDCACGVAVIPTDPTPDVSEKIRATARESGFTFRIIDVREHPGLVQKYQIKKLPAVIIEELAYPADVELIRKVIHKIYNK